MTQLSLKTFFSNIPLRSHLLLLGLISLVLISCRNKSEDYISTEGEVWNTFYHITYLGDESLKDSVKVVFDDVGHSLSVFEPSSIVSQINLNKSDETDAHFRKVYLISQRVNKLSQGLFDPTAGPLIDVWGFGKGHRATVDTLRLDSILQFVGLAKSSLVGNRLKKSDPRLRFNFSAVAKGYGCDAVGEMFKRNGVDNFMIEIGGEILLSGKSPRGKAWNILIENPVAEASPNSQPIVESLTDCGIATSGNYRNNHQGNNGSRYGHIISPLTGRPVKTDVVSMTVIAEDCGTADALATAGMAAGSREAEAIIRNAGAKGIIILTDSIIEIN